MSPPDPRDAGVEAIVEAVIDAMGAAPPLSSCKDWNAVVVWRREHAACAVADILAAHTEAAVRAERERCAKIAERELAADLILKEEDLVLVLEERRQIAEALRREEPPPGGPVRG